ncbi:hypothetical protein ACET3Z_018735 [Daucus carota]
MAKHRDLDDFARKYHYSADCPIHFINDGKYMENGMRLLDDIATANEKGKKIVVDEGDEGDEGEEWDDGEDEDYAYKETETEASDSEGSFYIESDEELRENKIKGEQGHGGNQDVQLEQTHVENAPSVKRKKLGVGRPKLSVRRPKTNTMYMEPNVITTQGSQVVQQSPTPPLMTESSETGHFMMQVLGSVGYSVVYTSTPATFGVPHATSTEEAFNLDD